jgi:mono/diheme cytochrome c family protein
LVGQAPRGVAVLPDGSRVFVACHDERALCTLDVASGKVKALPLPGWPDRLALDISDRPPTLLALSAQPGEALVSLLEPGTTPRMVRTHRFAGVTNPRGLTGLGLAGFGAPTTEVLLVHQRPRTKVPATQVAQGWVFTNAISRSAQTAVLDDPTTAYADPSDVVVAPDSRLAFVACAGADTVLAVRLDRFRAGGYGSRVANHTAAKDDLTAAHRVVAARLATQANPRRLALSGDGKTLVVSNHLADSLTVIDTQTPPRVLRHISLGGPPPDAARRGEVLFHSGRMTFQGQFTCASCHPGGGSDGLTWDLARDGVGNFLNTRALWGVRGTAPYGWHASSPTLADRVASTLRHTHQHEPQGTEVEDLVAYLKTLDWPRPLPDARKDSEAIARGRALFEGKGKCSSCHHGDDLYGETPHDVGTRTEGDISPRFDTPALRGLGRTAPYLHHGKASTLEEVLTTYNPAHRHGAAHLLSKEELADLLAYLHEL